jgi:hypothetical protein
VNEIKKNLELCSSTQSLFSLLDTNRQNFIDWSTIVSFLTKNATKKSIPTKRRVVGLLRRIQCTVNSKLSFGEFAKIVKPHYVQTFENTQASKERKRQQLKEESEGLMRVFEERENERKRPLTAFTRATIYIDKRFK